MHLSRQTRSSFNSFVHDTIFGVASFNSFIHDSLGHSIFVLLNKYGHCPRRTILLLFVCLFCQLPILCQSQPLSYVLTLDGLNSLIQAVSSFVQSEFTVVSQRSLLWELKISAILLHSFSPLLPRIRFILRCDYFRMSVFLSGSGLLCIALFVWMSCMLLVFVFKVVSQHDHPVSN